MTIYQHITRDEYEALPGVNWSSLKAGIGRSGEHIRSVRRGDNRRDSTAFKFGRALHQLILEPDKFGKSWTVIDGKTTTKAGHLTTAEVARMSLMASAWSRLGIVTEMVETALTWTYGGVECKCMFDFVTADSLGDLKGTQNASPDSFKHEVARYHYHGQLAYYRLGLAANGMTKPHTRIIAIEKDAPHAAADFDINSKWLELGTSLVDDLLEKFVDNSTANYGRQELPVPEWADSETLSLTIGDETVEV